MNTAHRLSVIATAIVLSVSPAPGQAPDASVLSGKIANWPAPAFWSPSGRADSLGERGEVGIQASTSPLPFIGVTPCRLLDTRPPANNPLDGDGIFGADEIRTYTLPGACGLPGGVQAVSLNITATNTGSGAFGHIKIWPSNQPEPNVSTLNYPGAGATIANAAIVPLSSAGALNVKSGNASADVILDVNGYYAGAGLGTGNTFLGLTAGNFTMTGDFNTGVGRSTLSSNTTGNFNTATGAFALQLNTTGDDNTATGEAALNKNTTGFGNTATGTLALANNTMGVFNTAIGDLALFGNGSGDGNTAIGANALGNTTGFSNIGIGLEAGLNHTVGSNNICIGNSGVVGESSTIRIGTVGIQTATFVAGISGTTSPGGVAVFVNGNGQLGTATSSRRVKEDIREIAEESDDLMRLRPVAFRYKPQIDPTGLVQYGLIAEEVADVYPDLVVYDRAGRPETVRYHLVNALLLNELQKQHRTAEAQEKTIETLKARLNLLEARLPANSQP